MRAASVAVMGGKLADFDNREVPDTLEAMWTYDCGTLVTFSQFNASSAGGGQAVPGGVSRNQGHDLFPGQRVRGGAGGCAGGSFRCSRLDRGAKGWRSGSPMIEWRQAPSSEDATVEHAENFLDCIKSRDGAVATQDRASQHERDTDRQCCACWNGMGRLSDS